MNTLRNLLLSALPALGTCAAHAQQVVAGAGAYHHSGNTAIAYTIGEPVIATVSAGSNTLTQGFHQPWADISSVVEEPSRDGDITVYPNPVRHVLHIALGEGVHAEGYILHDASGLLVADGRITGILTGINMERHASGSYHLRVSDAEGKPLKSFKISVAH